MDDPRPQITIRIDAWVQALLEWWAAWGLRMGLYLIAGILVLWSGVYQPFEFVLFIVLPLVTIGAWEVYMRVQYRRAILRELAGFCSHCGYDLRASKERCPECGTEMSLQSHNPIEIRGKRQEARASTQERTE